jgi:predicted CoA-binding protein
MPATPDSIRRFLAAKRIAVAGVSRDGQQTANLIYRTLRATGAEVFPVNPRAEQVEGVACHPTLAAVPGGVDAVMVVTSPGAAGDVARECVQLGVRDVWFHRAFGDGSVSDEAVRLLRAVGIEPIVGGCPLMFVAGADPAHRCFRWLLGVMGRMPK